MHFLDREACHASGSYRLDNSVFIEVFKVVCFSSYETMVLSGGHLFEHKAAQEIYRRYMPLFLRGQIRPVGKAATIPEFVDVKRLQYEHTAASSNRDYSIYFNSEWDRIFDGPISFYSPEVDTTADLAARLISGYRDDDDYAKRAIELIETRRHRAITEELFRSLAALSEAQIRDAALRISRYYQQTYRDRFGRIIFKNSGLITPPLEEGLGAELEYPVFRYLYEMFGFARAFKQPQFQFEQFRGSLEHVRFIDIQRTLFGRVPVDELWKIAVICARVLGYRRVATIRTGRKIEDQIHRVSNAFQSLGYADYEDLYLESIKPKWRGVGPLYHRRNVVTGPSVFIVVGARQELVSIRAALTLLGINSRTDVKMAGRAGDSFVLRNRSGADISAGILLANAKGKSAMSNLIEAIVRFELPRVILLVGMMAAIRGKAKILDVVIPKTIYDATTQGTRRKQVITEPETGSIDPLLHQWLLNHTWEEGATKGWTIILHKKTVTVAGKIDDISHELARSALAVDPENVVGLEMEGSSLYEKQLSQTIDRDLIKFGMIKGVADYAGLRMKKAEVAAVAAALGVGNIANPNPIENAALRSALQNEATQRAFVTALEVIRNFDGCR